MESAPVDLAGIVHQALRLRRFQRRSGCRNRTRSRSGCRNRTHLRGMLASTSRAVGERESGMWELWMLTRG